MKSITTAAAVVGPVVLATGTQFSWAIPIGVALILVALLSSDLKLRSIVFVVGITLITWFVSATIILFSPIQNSCIRSPVGTSCSTSYPALWTILAIAATVCAVGAFPISLRLAIAAHRKPRTDFALNRVK